MIDEAVLEEMLAELADEIPLPAGGLAETERVLATAAKDHRARPRVAIPLLMAAAILVILGVTVPMVSTNSSAKRTGAALTAPEQHAKNLDRGFGVTNGRSVPSTTVPAFRPPDGATTASGVPPSAPVDGAKILKTGNLDLQVPRRDLRAAVNRVTSVTAGLAGYVAVSKTSYGDTVPTAQITIRVPSNDFETAITRLRALPGVKVLGESENGTDVTAQYVDLQAKLSAATAGRDRLLEVLSQAETVGDILAVQDRVTAAQSTVDQLQGQINVLNDQAAYSSLAITLTEKPTSAAVAAQREKAKTGLSKAWTDARQGFSNSIEWIIARSGGALIVLLAALALLFGVRYLYPIIRRGLV